MLRSRNGIVILIYTLCIQLENASSEPIFKFVMQLDKIVLPVDVYDVTSFLAIKFKLEFYKQNEISDTYQIDWWTLEDTNLTFKPKIFEHNLLKGEDLVILEGSNNSSGYYFEEEVFFMLTNLEGDINLDCHPCICFKMLDFSLYGKISLKNINKARTYRIVTIIYYDILSKTIENFSLSDLSNHDFYANRTFTFKIDINYFNIYNVDCFDAQDSELFQTIFLKSDKFNQFKDGMKLHMSVIYHFDQNTIILWESNIEYNLSDSNYIRNIFDKELTYNGTSGWLKIETFSTNYGGKNLQYLCEFKNKNTICDENGKKTSVRKYIKNHDNCEKVDLCEENLCKNNAICKSFINNYECQCISGYYGKTCESILCNKNCIKCKAPYICEECKLGLSGDNCTIKTCKGYECGKGDCQIINNIRCCKCKVEYFGEKCSDTCSRGCNNGYCELYNGYVRCKCNLGYSGPNCLKKEYFSGTVFLKSTKFINNLMIITIIIVILIIIIFFTLIITKPKVIKVLNNSNAKPIHYSSGAEKLYSEHSAYPASKTDQIYDEETEKEQNHLYENIQIYEDKKFLEKKVKLNEC